MPDVPSSGVDTIPTETAELPTTRQTKLAIEEQSGNASTSKTLFWMLRFEFQKLKNQLREMCKQGFIQVSDSPQMPKFYLYEKKMEGLRVCVDYSLWAHPQL